MVTKVAQKKQRQTRVRKKIRMNTGVPRLSVFRSNQHIYAQIIDDVAGKTLVSVGETVVGENKKITKTERAKTVGIELAKKALALKVNRVIFDKGSYAYHGRVKAMAEGAREGGLSF